jgi:hypothetical protein
MEINTFIIGGEYGYKAFISEDTHKVLMITYEDPRSGGTIEKSKDGITECNYEFLKDAEKEVYDEIIRVKSGEVHKRYQVVNSEGIFGDFEKWELDYEHNKKAFLIPGSRIVISKFKNIIVLSF